jgi:hypothetical protein
MLVHARISPPCRRARLVALAVASNVDTLDGVPEIPIRNIIRISPVDEAASPVYRSLGGGVDPCWPNGDLDLGRGAGVLANEDQPVLCWKSSRGNILLRPVRGEGVYFVDGANDGAVDLPRQCVRLPIDLPLSAHFSPTSITGALTVYVWKLLDASDDTPTLNPCVAESRSCQHR